MSIPKVLIRQVKAARALLNWSQTELADASGVSVPTVKRLEAGDGYLGGRDTTAAKICDALRAAGIEFINENGAELGVRLRGPSP
jgi:transcriptional regulator with XRE-family HTH domain